MTNFPENGINDNLILEKISEIIRNLKKRKEKNLRSFGADPLEIAYRVIRESLEINHNNIGPQEFEGTLVAKMEREIISMISGLLGLKDADGYITLGGTESNIMGLWIGRNYLRNFFPSSEICLLKTSLTHYSIDKASDLLNIKNVINIPLNKEYEMDSFAFRSIIERQANDGIKNFLLVLTQGYNLTGTIDPSDIIDKEIKSIKEKLGLNFYVHLDAAIGGFIVPFLSDDDLGFNLESIDSISLDMHKFGLVPGNCGIFLSRKNFKENIERYSSYLPLNKDDTLSGSRPGVSVLAAWSSIHSLGKKGYEVAAKKYLEVKKYFIDEAQKRNLLSEIITNPLIPILAFKISKGELDKNVEKKYKLRLVSLNSKKFYFIVFTPQVTKSLIDEFIEDIS